MDFNKMVAQARKIQSSIEKKEKEFDESIFTFEKQGIKLVIKGNCEIVSLDINEIIVDPEDKETMQDLIIVTINEATRDILEKKKNIKDKVTQGLV